MFNSTLALLAGVATIATPCTLPVLPVLFGASIGQSGKLRPAMIAFGFVLSFSALALVLNWITAIFEIDPTHLREVAAIMLIAFGAVLIWPALFGRFATWLGGLSTVGQRAALTTQQTAIGGLVLGAMLGLIWTPCAGPVLGSILTVIATSADADSAHWLLVVYTIGAALPMLLIAYGGQAVTTRVSAIAPFAPRLQQGFGVLVILFAVASLFQYDTQIVAWLTGLYSSGPIGL